MSKVVIAAGGTGGHLFPAMQLAESLQGREYLFIGHKLKSSAFFDSKHPFQEITAHPFGPTCFVPIVKGFFQSLKILKSFQPSVVVSFGSYHTFPLLCAAKWLKIPLILFEANCHLGKVHQLFAKRAHLVASQFPLNLPNNRLVPFLPWKSSSLFISKQEARRHFGLDPEKQTVLVFGGSQGAAFLNEKVPSLLNKQDLQVIHLTGKDKRAHYKVLAYVAPFEKNMALAYLASDFAITRAGASTIAELLRYQVPALLIPFPHAKQGHQEENARYFQEGMKGGLFLPQSKEELLSASLEALLLNLPQYQSSLREYYLQTEQRISLSSKVLSFLKR